MREWIDDLSTWMDLQEKISLDPIDMSEEMYQTALEIDSLLQLSDQLESAYSQLLEKVDHVNS